MPEIELIDPRRGPRIVRLRRDGARLIRVFGSQQRATNQTQAEYPNEAAAELALARAVERLLFSGYQIGAHNPELVAAITAAPDELGNYLVYADWLLAQGDPRGDLIQLMVTLEQRPDDPELQGAIAQLRAEHRLRFERPSWDQLQLSWRWGFIEGLTAPAWVKRVEPPGEWPTQQLLGLHKHPSGRWVRRLRLPSKHDEFEVGFAEAGAPRRVLFRQL